MMNEIYSQQSLAVLSDISWVKDLQTHGYKNFSEIGFPNTKNEHWRYTSLVDFVKQQFDLSKEESNESLDKVKKIDFAYHLVIHNGQLRTKSEDLNDVIIMPLVEAIKNYPDKVKPYLDKINECEHGFHALNSAMLHNGIFIYVPEKITLTKPLWLTFYNEGENVAVYLRNLVVAGAHSKFSIIEQYLGEQNSCYVTNTITEVYADKFAEVGHYKIQQESSSSYHFGTLSIKQETNSHVSSHALSIGGSLVRSDTVLSLDAPYARCMLNGIYVPLNKQHMDFHTLINHNVENCTSEQDYKGVINDNARAVFNGRVIVKKNAVKSSAKQHNKNLLLSKNARVDTKPQLEIFNDDVSCAHGATVGQLDEDAVFYLATRGINTEDATRYLINAFAKENLENITDKTIRSFMTELLDEHLS